MAKAKTQKTDFGDMKLSIDVPVVQPAIDIDALTAKITEAVTKKLTAEFEGKMQVALQQIDAKSQSRMDVIQLTSGGKSYSVAGTTDGLSFIKDSDTVLLVAKNGQLATGTKSPRSYGKGSAHFRAGYPSEALLPSAGDGCTRGVIVEGDGDDDKTFVFRAVSRMNRQGVNILSDGSVAVGKMERIMDSTLGVYNRHSDKPGVAISVPSKDFNSSALRIESAGIIGQNWDFIDLHSEVEPFDRKTGSYSTNVLKVSGNGDVKSSGRFISNKTGYAEMFEWADGNSKNENRLGFTVALKHGKLIVADEGDDPIGVVVASSAVLGNAMWNHWAGKFTKTGLGEDKSTQYDIIEWLENETTILESHYASSLSKDFAVPENAIEIQTDSNGNDLKRNTIFRGYDNQQEYLPREERQGWAMVCLLGTVPVYKGQTIRPSWIILNSISDELELALIR